MKRFATTTRPRRRLMIFARVPERGCVKTRIATELGEDRTVELYEAMLSDVLDMVEPLRANTLIEVVWTATGEHSGEQLRHHFRDHDLAIQTGRDLGERLLVAFSERIFFHRAEALIAIGTDDPSLTAEQIEQAFSILESTEWVLGPASDGGYYLIGCRAGAFHPTVFDGITWGSEHVLRETRTRIRDRNSTLALLPVHTDIDLPEDLRVIAERGITTGSIARLLAEWGWSE